MLTAARVFAITYSETLPVQLGEWNWNFAEAKEMADRYQIPMVCLWTSSGCQTCKGVESAMDDETVLSWQRERKIVMCYQQSTFDEMYEFTRNDSGEYPYVAVYCPKADGTSVTNHFSGLMNGSLPWPKLGNTTAEHFVKSVESFISYYQPAANNSGDFICGAAGEEDRFEAVPGVTTFVDVPLSRTRATVPFAAVNYLEVRYPRDIGTVTNVVAWREGDETLYSRVAFPADKPLLNAEKIELRLYDAMYQFVSNRFIHVIAEPENTPKNPRWFGERDASTLAWGEWTVDLDAATNKVAAAEGAAWTLVGIVGSLWCPDCIRSDEFFLTQPEFLAWARDNKVALVSVDIPNLGKNLAPHIFSYDCGTTARSGTGYLSRHMVEPTAAAAVSERNAFLAREYFHRPEDTNPNRTGVPIFVLLRKDGTIAGRFTRLASSSPRDTSGNAAYVRRLTEMLETAGEADEIGNNHELSTASAMALGVPFEGRVLTHADAIDTVELLGVTPGAEVKINAAKAGSRNPTVTLAVIQLTNGVSKTLATRSGSLEGLSVAALLETSGARYFVKVSGNGNSDTGDFGALSEESTVTPYSLVSSMVLVPRETAVSFTPPAGSGRVRMRVEEDALYRLTGFPDGALDAAFSPLLGTLAGVCRAKVSGEVELSVSGEITYQLWKTGSVGFDLTGLEIPETAGVVTASVSRVGGVSGEASVRVTADLSQVTEGRLEIGTFGADGSFVAGEPVLVWAEGEEGARSFAIRVDDDEAVTGDETAVLTLAAEGLTEIRAEAAEMTVKVIEDDVASPGRLALTATEPVAAKGWTVYAPAGSAVSFDVSRLEGAEGVATAVLTAKLGTAKRPDLLDRTELRWRDKSRGAETVQRVTLTVPAEAVGKTLTVTLATKGAKAASDAKKLTVKAYQPEAPTFETTLKTVTLMKGVTTSLTVGVNGLTGGKASVTKLGGSLPPGMKATFVAKDGVLKISGTPTGRGAFTAGYRVSERRTAGLVAGGAVRLEIAVADARDIPGGEGAAAALSVSRTFTDIPMVALTSEGAGERRLAGLLTLTIPKSGRASAKYRCSEGAVSFTTQGWDEFDWETGTFTAYLLSSKSAYEGYRVTVRQLRTGEVAVEVKDPKFALRNPTATVDAADAWTASDSAADWCGQYTAALPFREYHAIAEGDTPYVACAQGSPCLTLKMTTKSALNAGRFTWACYLPNGKSASGSAILTRDGADAALLPVYVRDTKDFLTAILQVARGARAAYEETKTADEGRFATRVIEAPENLLGWWTHTESASAGCFSCSYDIYGFYYDPNGDLAYQVTRTGMQTAGAFLTGLAALPESPVHGAFVSEPAAAVTVEEDGLVCDGDVKFTFNRASGLAKGSFRAQFANGPVTVSWVATALPGWTGCGCHGEKVDLPLLIGAGWFADKVYYVDQDSIKMRPKPVSLKRGASVTVELAN